MNIGEEFYEMFFADLEAERSGVQQVRREKK